ncbi:MAG: hypothetical protein HQK55_08130 [Deltaproteobacteria bacterium]|nr:hypothetical protein [Deltaproteobacteria bacterium]
MLSTSFFNGVSPLQWYTSSLLNQFFGTNFSPTEGITGPIAASYSGYAGANQPSVSYAGSNQGQTDALSGLYKRQYDLIGKADQLSNTNSDSVLYRQSAVSGNSGVAKINYFDGNNYYGDVPDSTFNFNVTQIATGKAVQSNLLSPTAAAFTSGGTKAFTLTVGQAPNQTNYNIQFNVTLGENNNVVLNRMAQAINDAKSSVTASVTNGSAGIRLRLEGQTGTVNDFSLTDGSGTPVAAIGLSNTVQSAQNAIFTMNNADYNQPNNGVVLQNGRLLASVTGPGATTISVGPDTSSMLDSINKLVDSSNEFSSYLAANQYLNENLNQEWSGILSNAASKLADYGLILGPNNQLSLNSRTMTQALNNNLAGVREALGGYQGLVSDINSFAGRITSSPGASLLAFQPDYGYGHLYLRSGTSAPTFRVGSSQYWVV